MRPESAEIIPINSRAMFFKAKLHGESKHWFETINCCRLKQAKNTKYAFIACFRAYVGQPDDHIG